MIKLGITKQEFLKGEWYYEFEEETNAYHIYHTESCHTPYSYASKEEAEQVVSELNNELLQVKGGTSK